MPGLLGRGLKVDKYILNDAGEPVKCDGLMEWARWFESDFDKRRVARTELPGGVTVSTVFLGIDHNWGSGGMPVLYETMIFGGRHDECQWRCSTREEALERHAAAVLLAETALARGENAKEVT